MRERGSICMVRPAMAPRHASVLSGICAAQRTGGDHDARLEGDRQACGPPRALGRGDSVTYLARRGQWGRRPRTRKPSS